MSESVAFRVLVTVHGYERAGWPAATGHVVSRWAGAVVRVLALLDVPCPPRTSPTWLARRAYDGARAEWRRLEEHRLDAAVHALLPHLPVRVDVARIPCVQGDPVRTIVEHLEEWPADVIVTGAPAHRRWLGPRPLHDRLVRRVPCAVLVTPAPRTLAPRTVRLVPAPQVVAAHRGA